MHFNSASYLVSRFIPLGMSLVLAACGGGGGGGSGGGNTAAEILAQSTGQAAIAGTAQFQRPELSRSPTRLNYNNIATKPIRLATVELVSGSPSAPGPVLRTTATDSAGNYQFSNAPAGIPIFVRVLAQSITSRHNFSVRDNTAGNALYSLTGSTLNLAPAEGRTENLTAGTGWNGSGYNPGERVGGVFNIYDVVMSATDTMASALPSAVFSPLGMYWSPSNRAVSGSLATGNIGTSFYSNIPGQGPSIYILGDENVDTDEFDDPVIAHEWGHYFQSVLARDMSPGGSHTLGQPLDARLSFSEGWGNAWQAVVLNNPRYADTSGNRQGTGFSFGVDGDNFTPRGFYAENSTQNVIFELARDVGIGPVALAFQSLRASDAATTIFALTDALRAQVAGNSTALAAISASLTGSSISTTADRFGVGETNNNGSAGNLPLHLDYSPGVQACVATDRTSSNRLGAYRYIKFNTTSAGPRAITLTPVNLGGLVSTPRLELFLANNERLAFGGVLGLSLSAVNFPAGNHVLAVTTTSNTGGAELCYSVNIN